MKRLTLVLFVAIAMFSAFPIAPLGPIAYAMPTELFFSEYVEGTSDNKALEIYNGTESAIDLAAAGYNVQIFYNGSSTGSPAINLTGTVADGDVFVLAHSNATSLLSLVQADQTSGALNFNGNDGIVLRRDTAIVDVFGQIGVNPGISWGADPATTFNHTLQRMSSIVAGDTNSGDAFYPSLEWNFLPVDTFSGLGTHSVAPVPIPSTLLLMGSGLVGLIGIGRKRLRK